MPENRCAGFTARALPVLSWSRFDNIGFFWVFQPKKSPPHKHPMTPNKTLGIFLNLTIYTIEIHIFDMVDAIFTSGIHFIPVSRTGSGQFTPFYHRHSFWGFTAIISGDCNYPKSTFNNILTKCCTLILQSLIDLRYKNRPSLLVTRGAQIDKEPSGQPWVAMPCQWTPKTFSIMLAKL